MAAIKKNKIEKNKVNIVSVHLSPKGKENLDSVCENRGMTIKSLLGRLITWFTEQNKTEQSIILGHVENEHVVKLTEILARKK